MITTTTTTTTTTATKITKTITVRRPGPAWVRILLCRPVTARPAGGPTPAASLLGPTQAGKGMTLIQPGLDPFLVWPGPGLSRPRLGDQARF